MQTRDLFSVILKLFGVWLLASMLVHLPQALASLGLRNSVPNPFEAPVAPLELAYIILSIPVVELVLGLVFLFGANAIAALLVKEEQLVDIAAAVRTGRPVVAIYARLLGLLLAARAIVNLATGAWLIRQAVAVEHFGMINALADTQAASATAAGVAGLVLGVYLLTGARHLLDIIFPSERQPKAEAFPGDKPLKWNS